MAEDLVQRLTNCSPGAVEQKRVIAIEIAKRKDAGDLRMLLTIADGDFRIHPVYGKKHWFSCSLSCLNPGKRYSPEDRKVAIEALAESGSDYILGQLKTLLGYRRREADKEVEQDTTYRNTLETSIQKLDSSLKEAARLKEERHKEACGIYKERFKKMMGEEIMKKGTTEKLITYEQGFTCIEATVNLPYGIHARPSSFIAKYVARNAGDREVSMKSLSNPQNTYKVSCRSIMGLMTLEASKNSVVKIYVQGEDKEAKDLAIGLKLDLELDDFYKMTCSSR